MTQNDPKTNDRTATAPSSPILRRISLALASGTCVFALSLPFDDQRALADAQVTRQSSGGTTTWTFRKINPAFGGIQQTRHGVEAPGNNCPIRAFEVMNPKRGELRCVGYVAPW